MPSDTAAKGSGLEDRFIAILERMGYRCEKARAVRLRYGGITRVKTYDFFKCLDVLAFHRTLPPLAAQVTTDSQSVAGKARAIEPMAPWLKDFGEVLVARWISPDLPGQRGAFGLYRLREGFQTRHLLPSDAVAFPWGTVRPEPMALRCPACDLLHIDEGEWATRPHRTHLCSGCGHEWRPSERPTVGVDGCGRRMGTKACGVDGYTCGCILRVAP